MACLTNAGGNRTIRRVHYQPINPAKKYQRRRIIAAILVVAVALVFSAGVGVAAQHIFGWDHEEWARHNSIVEPGVNNAPDGPVAVEDEDMSGDPAPEIRQVSHPNPIPSPPGPGASNTISIASAGMERKYIVSLPPDVQFKSSKEEHPLPLILAYHGLSESPESIARYSGMGQSGAIVVYPAGVDKSWSGASYAKTTGEQDLAFTRNIIDEVSSTYQVDRHRIFAAGMSNGGGFVYKLACEMPEMFTAVASVAGAYYSGTWQGCAGEGGSTNFPEGRTVPFLEIHGRQDDRIKYGGGQRDGDNYLSAVQAASSYAQRAGCQGAPITTQATSQVQRIQWSNCTDDNEVLHLGISDAGHVWPGEIEKLSGSAALNSSSGKEDSGAITATSEILAFFGRHGL